ncbi:MAG: FtsX-like permease family protein [Candidatus Saccharibacteria bacterium]
MNVFSRGLRNAFRNPIRTFSLVAILGLSIGLALAMLVAYQAVGQKISSIQSSVGNIVSISPAGVRGFEGGGNPLTTDQINPITKLPNVTSVTLSLNDRLTTADTSLVSSIEPGTLGRRFSQNNGDSFTPPPDATRFSSSGTRSFTPPVTLVGTTTPTILSNTQGGGTFVLKSGKVFESNSMANDAVIGSSLATKNNLTVGSTFTAYSASVNVVGIFDAGNSFANNQVIMPLATVQTLSGQPGQITAATVNVNSITNIDSVTMAVKNMLGATADVTNSSIQAQAAIAPLQNIRSISLYSLVGAVVAGSVIILLTMIMIVRERRREIGVLKAIGASNVNVMTQFTTEAVTLTVMGAVIGIVLGVVGGNPITKLLVTNSANSGTPAAGAGRLARGTFGGVRNNLTSIHGVVGWNIILYGLLAAIVIAIIGSTIASYFIAKIRPADVMRAE